MKKNTSTPKVPSTREESLNMIIRQFLDSDKSQIRLLLYPEEISKLEEYQEIVIHYKNGYHPNDDLSLFIVSKRKDLPK